MTVPATGRKRSFKQSVMQGLTEALEHARVVAKKNWRIVTLDEGALYSPGLQKDVDIETCIEQSRRIGLPVVIAEAGRAIALLYAVGEKDTGEDLLGILSTTEALAGQKKKTARKKPQPRKKRKAR